MTRNPSQGSCFTCTWAGGIVDVFSDRLGLGLEVGKSWTDWLDPGGAGRAASMTRELHDRGRALDWELQLLRGGAPMTVHVAGVRTERGFLLVCASGRNELVNECAAMARRDGGTHVIALLEELRGLVAHRLDTETRVLEDMSRMNNELVTLQRERVRLHAKLERSNEERNRLLGTVAHDLRSPLGVVLGYARLLGEEHAEQLPAEARQMLAAIERNASYMQSLVSDVLDLAAVESGRVSFELHRQDVTELLQLVAQDAEFLARRKGITVVVEAKGPGPVVELDPRRTIQALMNLVDNAVKFGPAGSTLRLGVRRHPEHVDIFVADEGRGFPTTGHVDEFFVEGERGSAGERSTGLGLAIVRRILEGHGGELVIESGLDTGTEVILRLPVRGTA